MHATVRGQDRLMLNYISRVSNRWFSRQSGVPGYPQRHSRIGTSRLATAALVFLMSGLAIAADFDGDRKGDILWRNTTTGGVAVWLMNGGAVRSYPPVISVDKSWVVQGVGDFNGDGKSDILWRNSSTGIATIWLMNGGALQSSVGAWTVSSDWVFQGIGDFNGDRKSDILWRNTKTGAVAIWLMNGGVVQSYSAALGVDGSWVVQGIGDFNGDGKSD